MTSLRETKVCYPEEESRAGNKDIIIIFMNVRESTWSRLSYRHIDNKMRRSRKTHDLAADRQRKNLRAIKPGGGVEETVVTNGEEIDTERHGVGLRASRQLCARRGQEQSTHVVQMPEAHHILALRLPELLEVVGERRRVALPLRL